MLDCKVAQHIRAHDTEPDDLSFRSPRSIHAGRRELKPAGCVTSIRMLQHAPSPAQ